MMPYQANFRPPDPSSDYREFFKAFFPTHPLEYGFANSLLVTAVMIEEADLPMTTRRRLFQLYTRFAELARQKHALRLVPRLIGAVYAFAYVAMLSPHVLMQLVRAHQPMWCVVLSAWVLPPTIGLFAWWIARWNFRRLAERQQTAMQLRGLIQRDYLDEPHYLDGDLAWLQARDQVVVSTDAVRMLICPDTPDAHPSRLESA